MRACNLWVRNRCTRTNVQPYTRMDASLCHATHATSALGAAFVTTLALPHDQIRAHRPRATPNRTLPCSSLLSPRPVSRHSCIEPPLLPHATAALLVFTRRTSCQRSTHRRLRCDQSQGNDRLPGPSLCMDSHDPTHKHRRKRKQTQTPPQPGGDGMPWGDEQVDIADAPHTKMMSAAATTPRPMLVAMTLRMVHGERGLRARAVRGHPRRSVQTFHYLERSSPRRRVLEVPSLNFLGTDGNRRHDHEVRALPLGKWERNGLF